MITMINIDQLVPHPDNPRKNIGDLTELADSIKAVGIMQNLTVVPYEDKYRILIGHRRASAAKLAGLESLPCMIVDMDEKDQIEIMLIENMQRSDLTVMEESQGLQMMMDMGNTIGNICEKTGFSESKVRHRIKMQELDQDVLKKRFDECQNISIMDLQKLEQIKDQELRNEALKHIGTPNFESKIKSCVAQERYRSWEKEILDFLGDMPEIENTEEKRFFVSFREWINNDSNMEKVRNFDGQMYFRKGYQVINIYTDIPENETQETEKRREASRLLDERKYALKEVLERMKELRRDFVKNLSNRDCGYFLFYTPAMQKILLAALVNGGLEEKELLNLLDVQIENEPESWKVDEWEKLLIDATKEVDIRKMLLCGLYLTLEPGKYDTTFDYYAIFKIDHDFKKVYEFMNIIGYEMSDEEKQILDGTHELYVKEEDDE